MQCRRSRVSEASAISMSSWCTPPETGGAGRIVATLEGSASVGGEQVLGLGESYPVASDKYPWNRRSPGPSARRSYGSLSFWRTRRLRTRSRNQSTAMAAPARHEGAPRAEPRPGQLSGRRVFFSASL